MNRKREAHSAFYNSWAWRQLRKQHLAEHPLCEECLRAGRTTVAEHVHHVIDVADDPSRALDDTNLESLCHGCHSRETLTRTNTQRRQSQPATPTPGW